MTMYQTIGYGSSFDFSFGFDQFYLSATIIKLYSRFSEVAVSQFIRSFWNTVGVSEQIYSLIGIVIKSTVEKLLHNLHKHFREENIENRFTEDNVYIFSKMKHSTR